MGKISFFTFIRDQYSALPAVDAFKSDLTGKTVIVVGSNTGLGLEASRHFATMNPGRLILACRNVAKGEEALKSIRTTTKYEGGEVWEVDLADFSSISTFVNKFESEGGGKLDLLVENSGIATRKYELTKDGWESTLQTNHLGTAMLGILLLPYLSKAPVNPPTPRLVVVSSDMHFFAKFDENVTSSKGALEKLNDEQYCTQPVMRQRYSHSKLLNIFFARSFASRLAPQNPVIVNAVNPGFCHSELRRNVPPGTFMSFLMALMEFLFARSTEVGSRTLVHAALGSPENGKNLHGHYLSNCRVEEESDYSLSKEARDVEERVWNETIEILSKADPRIKEIVAQYLTNRTVPRTY